MLWKHWISIHALREEGDPGKAERAGLRGAISIHALREEGDLWPCCAFTTAIISIHALREEGDSGITVGQYVSDQFLSTPSARRATCAVTAFRKQLQIISIHALREEGDPLAYDAL